MPYRGGSTQIVPQTLELMMRLLATMPRRNCVPGQSSLVVRRALKASTPSPWRDVKEVVLNCSGGRVRLSIIIKRYIDNASY